MIALQILDVKQFMSKILKSDIFDHFLLSEALIHTHHTYTIDGHINKDFYSQEELESANMQEQTLTYWKELKSDCFEIIRGKKTPLGFRFIFLLSPENVEKLVLQSGLTIPPRDIKGLFLNIKFERNILICTTGTSKANFTLDKSLDMAWDSMIKKFFKHHEITFEDM